MVGRKYGGDRDIGEPQLTDDNAPFAWGGIFFRVGGEGGECETDVL